MTKDNCPQCDKKHRVFPRQCYYAVHADHAHCVIANLAKYGNQEQKEYTITANAKWDRMHKYACENFPNDVKDLTE